MKKNNCLINNAIFVFLLSAFTTSILFAQNDADKRVDMFHNWSKLLSPEKVYLHTDKDVYFATDTIWFSGYVENSSYASEFEESNYIYVELISRQLYKDPNSLSNYAEFKDEVVVRKKIKRIDNSFQGYLVVPEKNSTGRAIIRGYTYWMLNRSAGYMFYKELEITNPMKDKLVEAMIDKQVKRKKDYLLIGELSPEDKRKQEEKDAKERYDVQFLPESGNYLSGDRAVVYIKSIDRMGSGASVYGEIVDSAGNVIQTYSTDSLGFGKVDLPNVPSVELKATVKDLYGYEGENIPLPSSLNRGVTITGKLIVNSMDQYSEKDIIRFEIKSSKELVTSKLSIFLHNGSEVYYSRPIYKYREFIAFGLKALNPGIHAVSILDEEGNIYAERPFCVLPDQNENLKLSAEKRQYKTREMVNVKLQIPNEILDDNSNFSVSVTDMGLASDSEKTTIISYMLLKSELKGYIENIDWYFNGSVPLQERMRRMDMLMQTQGWRYYEFDKIVQSKSATPIFGKEYNQTLFGRVVNMSGIAKNTTVSFLAPSINFKAMGYVDSGYFVLNNVDFPEGTRFIVGAIGKNGRSIRQTPELQKEYFAPEFKYPVSFGKVVYSEMFREVVEDIYYARDDGGYSMAFDLEPVVITSQTFRPKNSPSPIANYPIRREWYRDTSDMKAYSLDYDISSYVVAAYPGIRLSSPSTSSVSMPEFLSREPFPAGSLISNNHVSAGSMRNMDLNTGEGIQMPSRYAIVLIYLNGSFIYPREAVHTVLSLPLSEIESMIFVSGINAAPFQPSFSAGELSPYPVLMVRTKPHVRTDAVPYNVTSDYPLGWQKPVKFYSPKYDNADARRSTAKDNRITLYWNPSVKFDSEGVAYVSFYTSDSDSNYRVEVEGRSAARQYHYAEKIIERVKESAPSKKK